MKYYIIAGEASGDLHGSNLIHALRKKDPKAEIRCWGGELMKNAGATLVKNYKELAFMGFWEVLINLKTILKNLRLCREDIDKFNPDRIVYIDYPGFNLRIARWAHEKGFKNHYYISPQVWAWKENRVADMKKNLDALYVILPFESAYFKNRHNFKTHFVGHPLRDALDFLKPDVNFFERNAIEKKLPLVALLPGSRKQEVKKMLPLFLKISKHFPNYQFIVAGAPGLSSTFYELLLKGSSLKIVCNQTYSLLSFAKAALVTSGTATLETALFNVPQMVCYKSSFFTYFIGKRLVRLNYISLVNLILDKEAVRELIQHECNEKNIIKVLREILSTSGQQNIKSDYKILEEKLGPPGASERVANLLLEQT